MVEKKTLARPYAKAIVELADSTGDQGLWSEVLSLLVEMTQSDKIQQLIHNKSLARPSLEKILLDLCVKPLNTNAKNLIKILIYHRRLYLLPEILESYKALCLEAEGRVQVNYYTSKPLDSFQKEAVYQHLSRYFQKTLVLDYYVEEALLGGYVARAGSRVIDASISGYLDDLKGANV